MSADILRRAAEVEWRAIPGFPGYEASNDGHVRTLRPYGGVLRVLSEWPNPQGYLTVQLGPRGKRTRVTVHRMVMLAFVGPRPPGKEIAHWDGDKTNNALTNLRYATPKENGYDGNFGVAATARAGLAIVVLYLLCALGESVFYRVMSQSFYFFLVLGLALRVGYLTSAARVTNAGAPRDPC